MVSICLDTYHEDQINSLIDKSRQTQADPSTHSLTAQRDIGTIAEREVTLKRFEHQLKLKRSTMTLCYLLLFVVELIYHQHFSFWALCPLLLSVAWFCLLTLDTNFYGHLRKYSVRRVLFIFSLTALNMLTVVSLIVIYSSSFMAMHHFNHHADYSFKLVLTFDILFALCSLCIDIDVVDYGKYTVIAHKCIFLGILNEDRFRIEEVHGLWVTKHYTFAHPSALTQHSEPSNELQRRQRKPIGVWQKLILLLFVMGMLGAIGSVLHGIHQMQPYIEH